MQIRCVCFHLSTASRRETIYTVTRYHIHPPSLSNCTIFCLGVQFVSRDLLHISNSRKKFNVRMKVIFGEKSLSSLFRILRQELTTVFPAMWYCFTTAKGAENWSRAVHVRPRGFERCPAIFGASFAGLFWALQETSKYPTNLHNSISHSCASFGVSLTHQKHTVLQGQSNCVAC